MPGIQRFIHSLNKYLSACYLPGTVLGTKDMVVNRTVSILSDRQINNYIKAWEINGDTLVAFSAVKRNKVVREEGLMESAILESDQGGPL